MDMARHVLIFAQGRVAWKFETLISLEMIMKKTLLSLAITASLGLVSNAALAYNAATDAGDVTIQESAINGTPSNLIVADQLNGNYTEIFSTTGFLGGSTYTFNTLAFFNAGSWFNNGTPQSGYLNFIESGGGYRLYALFQSSGTYTLSGGNASFVGATGMIELWADPDQNTTKTLPGTAVGNTLASITLANNGDDQLLGFATLMVAGNGNGHPGSGANGDFELVFGNWTLTAVGESYFIAPRPFYMTLDVNGNFQSFDPTSVTDVAVHQSSANAFFVRPVPEPATLALMGLGLVGLGMSRRRKS
jgi:hypothetical protein